MSATTTRTPPFADELVDAGVDGPVEVLCWNPDRPRFTGRIGRRLPIRRPVDNFGDLLGPEIVRRVLRMRSLDAGRTTAGDAPRTARLLSVGSILHFARPGDVIWGSGVNGRIPADWYDSVGLDVRSVRGPLTAEFLEGRGYPRPTVFGDPALLVPALMPELLPGPAATRDDYCVVPNMHDHRAYAGDPHVVDPRSPWRDCIRRIARARAVYASSLHGLIIADALRIPVVHLHSSIEADFKYRDYALGSGSKPLAAAATLREAMQRPPVVRGDFDFDADALTAAFPIDLWEARP